MNMPNPAKDLRILEVKDRAYESLSRFIRSEIKLEEALNNILDLIVEFFDIRAGSIFLLDSTHDVLDFNVVRGDKAEALKHLRIKKGEGIAGKVALTGQPIIQNDALNDPGLNRNIGQRLEYIPQKILCVPLRTKQVIYGVIEIMDKRNGESFTDDDANLLLKMADPITIMIDNITLFQSKEDDIRRLSTFVLINKQINTAVNFQVLLSYIMASAKDILETEGSSLLLIDDKTHELYFNVVENDSGKGDRLKEIRVPVGVGIAGIVAESGEPLIINDAQHDHRVFRKADELTSLKTRNILAVPIRVQGKIIGVLEVINSLNHEEFTQNDLHALQSMADQAGIAITNRNLIESLKASNVSLAKRIKELTAINRISLLIGKNMDYDINTLFQRTIEIIAESLEIERISLFIKDEESGQLRIVGARGIGEDQFNELSPSGKIMGQIFLTGNPILVGDITESGRFGHYKRFRYKTKSFLCVPLKVKQKTVGILNLADKKSGIPFDLEDLQTIETIAMQISETYENSLFYQELIDKQRLERELEVASKIQQSILPSSFPSKHGLDIAAASMPATEIGGDFYDITDCGHGTYAAYIADVSGKGIPAALFMALSHSAMRIVSGSLKQPEEVLSKANNFIISDSRKGMFVTLFYLLIDTQNLSFSYACAGHNEQIHYDSAADELKLIKSRGIPLGIMPDRNFPQVVQRYNPGDFIVLYTDGVLDAINEEKVDFSMERLLETIRSSRNLTAAQIVARIQDEVEAFCGEIKQFDDLTLMVIKFS